MLNHLQLVELTSLSYAMTLQLVSEGCSLGELNCSNYLCQFVYIIGVYMYYIQYNCIYS